MNTQQRVAAGLFLLLALLAVVSLSSSGAGAGAGVIRMQLSHTDAGRGLTRGELLQRMVLRSKTRAAARLLLSSSATATSGRVTPGQGEPWTEYLVSFAIGTPPQPVKMTLDTGSDLIWTQCQPCVACYDQALPYFDMSDSTTFVPVPCTSSTCRQLPWPSCGGDGDGDNAAQALVGIGNQTSGYTYLYADMSVTSGLLAADTFTFADGGAAADGLVTFGCGFSNQGLLDFNSSGTGIAGFGRGALSLPSQLNVDSFSYCFTDITGSTPSAVLLGLPPAAANLNLNGGGATVQTTPLNTTSSPASSSYYLNLRSITVGSTTLPVPASAFALKDDGVTGGTIIDSGTSITLLPPPVYSLLRDAFVSELNTTPPVAVTSLPDVLCFPAATTMPKLQLQFEGATLDLPQENYVFAQDEDTVCVAIESSGGDVTIIGNYQQQNMHVLYDLAGDTLSFVPAQCDMLVSSIASSHAALHACGWAYSLCTLLSIVLLFVVKLY